MGFIINTFLKYLVEDLPLVIVSFICMFLVIQVYLPKTSTKQKWESIFIIEGFEHLVLPLVLIIVLLITDSWLSAFLFHFVLLGFLFLFIGLIIIKAKTKEDWFRILAIASFAYFFLFLYPFILIYIQLNSNITGWLIMILTILLFLGLYLMRRKDLGTTNNKINAHGSE